tara:strand:- start:20015 stop:21151 length:1137 start_codon:yes stop_codon:yes gene_type:complete
MEDIKESYKIREDYYSNFSYWFDKITGLFFKSKMNKIQNPRKVLFLRNDHIGDMVYSSQVFREIKKIFPGIKVSVVASRGNRGIIEKDHYIDEIIECDLFWRRGLKGFLDYLKVLKKIKREKFDLGFDLRRSKLNIIFFLWIPKIKSRISYYNINGGKAFLTHPIFYDKKINFYLEPVEMLEKGLNIKIENPLPEIVTDKKDEKIVKKMLKEKKLNNYVVFAPGATFNSKKWPSKNFDKLIEKFHKKYPGYKIVLSGSKGDKNLIKKLCSGREFCVPLINFDLRLMAIVFRNAGVVVANDGAGTAVSCVAGANLVSLVGPVDLELHKPIGNFEVLHHTIPCYPCDWTKDCERPCGKWCMELIEVDEVLQAVEKFMKTK